MNKQNKQKLISYILEDCVNIMATCAIFFLALYNYGMMFSVWLKLNNQSSTILLISSTFFVLISCGAYIKSFDYNKEKIKKLKK